METWVNASLHRGAQCLGVVLALAALILAGCGKNPDELLTAAKSSAAKGERTAAVLQLKSLLQDNPEHAESRLYLGLLYNESGDFRGAEKELRRALELRIDPARVLPALGKALIMQGEAKKVLAEVSLEGLKEQDAIASVLAVRGLAHIALRQTSEAKAAFDQALGVKPGHADAVLGLARLLAGERKLEEALAQVDRALEADSKSAEGLMLRGDLLRAAGKREESTAAYQKVVDLYPDHVSGLFALVSSAIASGQYDDASKHLATVRKTSPGNPMASYFQALVEFRKGNFKAARDAIGQILKVAPNHLPSVLLGGAVEFALGSHELAQARLKYVLDRTPGNPYARRLLVASYTRAGQTHKAMELLEPVLKQGTKDPALLALAGEVHMQLNEYDKAKGYFEKAASLDPKNPSMRTGLGLSRLAAGEVELATADLESATLLDTSKYRADVLLISTYLQSKQYDQAIKAAQSLIQKQSENPMGYNLLAAGYLAKKDLTAARKSLEKALEVQPGYTPAASNLAQLDLQNGDKKSARKRFEDIIAADKANVQAYVALASLGPRIDATQEEIRKWLESARKESPGTIQPLVMLARFHLSTNEPKKALELVEKALIEAPNNFEVLELAGQVQLAAGEKNRALATFSKWSNAQPDSAMAAYRMATAQLANEDVNGAVGSLRKALTNRQVFPEAQILLADVEARNGRIAEALKLADQLQKQNTKSPIGWAVEGDVRMRGKQFAAAAKAFEKAHALAPSGQFVVKQHSALAQDGRATDGETRLREWLKQHPGDAVTRLYLAEVYLRNARFKDAIGEYELLATRQSENVVVLNNLAWCYLQIKDKRALETAEKALKTSPGNPGVMDTLGWILVESGEVPRGVELLKKAAALAPKSPEIRLHFAQGLMKAGDSKSAKAELERLLVDIPKFPGSDAAMRLLAELRK